MCLQQALMAALTSTLRKESVLHNSCVIEQIALLLCSTLRGVSQYCPLIKAVWSSRAVTDIVSGIAGLPLKPVMDYELGVCNVQVITALACPVQFDNCCCELAANSEDLLGGLARSNL